MRARALIVVLALVFLLVWGAKSLLQDDGPGPGTLGAGKGEALSPLAYAPERRTALEDRAAVGLSQVLFEKSPGGIVASAARTARYRALIDRIAKAGDVDPNVLEAIVLLESAGRPDAQASSDVQSAAGLTQILAQTATGLLGLKVDVAASRVITRRIGATTSERRRAALLRQRRVVDERFDPPKALQGTVRYLRFARDRLGRDDLAIVSYHMGVGNLQNALAAYGKSKIPYAQLFFDSSPLRHAAAWTKLANLGDDSSTYLWRVLAAKRIMSQWRKDPKGLARLAVQHVQKPSAERVLRPREKTKAFKNADALDTDALVQLDPALLSAGHLRLSTAMTQAPADWRTLRPEAAAVLRTFGSAVAAVAGVSPLTVTAATRDVKADAEGGGGFGVEAPPSLHTTGYAFDLSRAYRSPAQAKAVQFWLDRLTALNVIAWVRDGDVLHVAVGPLGREFL